jgi:hypothetical protein
MANYTLTRRNLIPLTIAVAAIPAAAIAGVSQTPAMPVPSMVHEPPEPAALNPDWSPAAMRARLAQIAAVLELPRAEIELAASDPDDSYPERLPDFCQRHHQCVDWILLRDARCMIGRLARG